ncbi:C2H2-type domain-containing protein [Caenorhabditis elegans]|uniref:C2H2-type domain-containing protein n=1 Tax=Caenorhabditis elegans TaxID=6239 RepID=O01527_CAEEL|nr:C2H2-type domain-containing protein [Caenorhabditis elegans]CCD69781.1 C2H2-type domain-containing protein [Caenorhabditis elegans]|eukprot:NP_491204.3 Uncharacterized protein CELE_F21A9.2 [Caenorhabditis elegans]
MDVNQSILHNTIASSIRKQVMTAPIEFRCGDCVGPYSVSGNGQLLRITLSNFTGESMGFEMESNPVTRRIQAAQGPLLANCVIMQTGPVFTILFTKNLTTVEPLRAILVADMNYRLEQEKLEKKHECPHCHVAKFNSLHNLKVHEDLYCSKKKLGNVVENADSRKQQNVILLPMAFHDLFQQNPFQVVGPVTIGRNSALINSNPLLIHNKRKLEMPNFSTSKLSVQIPIINLDEKNVRTSTPLDLSSSPHAPSVPSLSASCSPTSKSSSSEPIYPERPFSCTCGVSFSSQTTYDAHKQLYCSHTTRVSSPGGGPHRNDSLRKVPEKCTKCDFVPTSSSQLSMHIRSSHQTTKTFTCLVCGYRAFSMRGIRTHMRSHSDDEALKFKANEPDET